MLLCPSLNIHQLLVRVRLAAALSCSLPLSAALSQMVNRAYFTLISLSMVAAASRLAYDSLGRYQPQHLK
jgi:hypothetical protein